MRIKALPILLLVLVILGLTTGGVSAQTYLFSVDREEVDVYFAEDGTIAINYLMDISSSPSADPMEYIDIGLPTSTYDLGSVEAELDGVPITDIQRGDPQFVPDGKGVSLGLGSIALPPGQSATLHVFVGEVENVFYTGEDPDHPDYASFRFSPNYFGPEYILGTTDLRVTFHFPPGLTQEEPVYYPPSNNWPGNREPESGFDDQDRIFYSWYTPQGSVAEAYEFGAGFPAKFIPAGAIVKEPDTTSQFNSGGLCGIGFFILVLAFIGLIIYASSVASRKRKLQYLPPKIAIEGHGIKRGLTAIEAAILMEQPMDKILTMVLFSVIKKGAATVLKREPLELEISRPLPEELQPYEVTFLEAFEKKAPAERRTGLQTMMVDLVKSISEKMKGFSRKESIDFYTSIMNQAWSQVEAAGTPEVKAQKYEEVMDWTMLDRRYGERTQDVFRGGPVFVPVWWPRYDPVYRGSSGGGVARPTSIPTGTPGGGGSVSLPSLPGSDFAASVVNGVQAFSAGVIGDLASFTGGVTSKTNPVPKTSYTSGRTGGGGSGGRSCACACACACAGCACACAGGGR